MHAASMTGTVVLTERLGSETVLNIRLTDGSTMIAANADDQIFDKGQSVGLHLIPPNPSV